MSWALCAALAKSDSFWSTLSAMTDRMPLAPLLIAGVQSTLGTVPRAVAIIQAVIDAGTCTLRGGARARRRHQPLPAAIKTKVARQMARLRLAAHTKAWLEGMAVSHGAPELLADPRVRALRKPSFYNTPGACLWERVRAYVFGDPGRYQILLVVGLIAMLPFLVLEAIGFVMLARMLPWAAALLAACSPTSSCSTDRSRPPKTTEGNPADCANRDPLGVLAKRHCRIRPRLRRS